MAPEPNVTPLPGGEHATDLALKRYDAVFRYLAYENSVYWTRAQFFLLANTALAAFVLNQMPMGAPAPTWNRLGIIGAASATGVALTWLWRAALETGEQWLRHWEEVLTHDLEADAFGPINLVRHWEFRTPPPAPKRSHSAKKLAHWLAVLFRVVWLLSAGYVLLLGCAKAYGWAAVFSN